MAEISREEFELIKSVFVFKGADEGVLSSALADLDCERRSYRRGDCIFDPQNYFRALGVMLSGSVQVSKEHRLAISRLKTGDVFGAAALFNSMDSFATTLTALEPTTVIFFPEALIKKMMTEDFTVAENYIRYQSGRIRFLSSKIDGLSAGSAESRLAKYLLDNTADCGTVAASMTQLADMLNIGRASLYRAIDVLVGDGAVEKQGKRLIVTDHSRLQNYIK